MKMNHLSRSTMTLAVILVLSMAACRFTPSSTPAPDQSTVEEAQGAPISSPESPLPSEPTRPSANMDPLAVTPDPLDNLLALRSVQFTLESKYPDGSLRIINCEIDNAGNMHILTTEPAMDVTGMPEESQPPGASPQVEIFVLDGKAYTPDDLNPEWKTTPADEDFISNFSIEIHGMDGPALWLNLLPAGSVFKEVNETVGEFNAQRYRVEGVINGEKVTGSFWKDLQTNALVQAEIHIPAVLLTLPDELSTGELLITLRAQRAEIAEITLP